MENKVSIHGSHFNVNNSSGTNIGNISASQSHSSKFYSQIIDEIIDQAKKLSSSKDIVDEEKYLLDQNIKSIEKFSQKHPVPNKIVQESLKTIRNVAEGITGSTLATGLLHLIGNII